MSLVILSNESPKFLNFRSPNSGTTIDRNSQQILDFVHRHFCPLCALILQLRTVSFFNDRRKKLIIQSQLLFYLGKHLFILISDQADKKHCLIWGFEKIFDSVRFLMDLEPAIRMEKINKAI